MQFIKLLFVLVILIEETSLSELRMQIKTSDGSTELEEAAIQVLTSCYANKTKTIALIGDYSSSFIEKLTSDESFALVSMNDRVRSENALNSFEDIDHKRKHKVDILVAVVPSHLRFQRVLFDFWCSLYDNPMALTVILAWSPRAKNAGCDTQFFYHSNSNNHLNTILMCYHGTNRIVAFTSNPFKNQAPKPWHAVRFTRRVRGYRSFLFYRKYRAGEGMCKNLTFDKTRDLNGWKIKVHGDIELVKHKNGMQPDWSPIRGDRLYEQEVFGIINSFISYVNASMVIRYYNLSGFQLQLWDEYMVPTWSIRGGGKLRLLQYIYPRIRVYTFLISNFRGNKSQLSKILGVIDDYSWVGMFFAYLITLLFFKYFLRQLLPVAILNLCRLTCNSGLTTLPRNAAPQIYLSCLLFFIVTMQGIFTGNLASLLTHDFPARQVDTIQDVIDLNYTVHCEFWDTTLFDDPRLKGRVIVMEKSGGCIEKPMFEEKSVCVGFTYIEKHRALKANLYVSRGYIDETWGRNLVPWRWSLLERFNAFQGILVAAGVALPFQTMVDAKRLSEFEALEIALEPEIMIWRDLSFAFVILGVGLVFATVTFIGEITIHWYYRRGTTTRVIVLTR